MSLRAFLVLYEVCQYEVSFCDTPHNGVVAVAHLPVYIITAGLANAIPPFVLPVQGLVTRTPLRLSKAQAKSLGSRGMIPLDK